MLSSVTHVAITTDTWKSNNQSYVPITVHFIYKETWHASLLGIEEFHDAHCRQELLLVITAKN